MDDAFRKEDVSVWFGDVDADVVGGEDASG